MPVVQVNNRRQFIELLDPARGGFRKQCKLARVRGERPCRFVTAIDQPGALWRKLRVLEDDIVDSGVPAFDFEDLDSQRRAGEGDIDFADSCRAG